MNKTTHSKPVFLKKDGTPKNTEAMKPKHGKDHPFRRKNDQLINHTYKALTKKKQEKYN